MHGYNLRYILFYEFNYSLILVLCFNYNLNVENWNKYYYKLNNYMWLCFFLDFISNGKFLKI